MKKLSIIIPAYNEERTLRELIEKVLSVKFFEISDLEIIIINDGSKDKTMAIAKKLAAKFSFIKAFENEVNMGKSQSVKNGILKSTGDIIIIQDADFEYDPLEINLLIEKMHKHSLDVVYGNRFGKKNEIIYFQNYFGNKALSFISNIFTYPRIKTWIPDMEVCYKLINASIARDIAKTITSKSTFGIEPEITAKLSQYKLNKRHLRFGIVPISYYPRDIKNGKKLKAFEDGRKALKEIFKYNLKSKPN